MLGAVHDTWGCSADGAVRDGEAQLVEQTRIGQLRERLRPTLRLDGAEAEARQHITGGNCIRDLMHMLDREACAGAHRR